LLEEPCEGIVPVLRSHLMRLAKMFVKLTVGALENGVSDVI